jgi:Ca-activated chloride channel family protein
MNVFETLHFIRPLWLFLLPLAVILPWAWKRLNRPAGDWARACDPHLLRWLSVRQVASRQQPRNYWLAAVALLLAIVALAGPSWQKLPDTSYSARNARVIVMDLSRSMLAGDLRPDRLTRARFRLADLLASTTEGQVGLVSYAGDAYVVSPLTSDMNTVINLLPALRPDIIPVAGSRADIALEMAATLLERSGMSRGEILLVTDSAKSRDAAKARELRDAGMITSVLAVGTPDGAPIPSGGGFVSDRSGNVVIARMDRSELRALAQAGGGKYTELEADNAGAEPWIVREGSEFALREDALGERWKDAGPWLVLLLLPFALAGFRRGLFFMIPLVMSGGLLAPQPAKAAGWEDLWLTRDQQAYAALREDNAEKAAALAKSSALSGEAWYRSGEYSNALDAWAAQDTAESQYNRGNALALMGELDASIAAYDRALALNPEMEDALYNRALVEKMREQQQQQENEEGDSQEGESSSEQEQGDPSESEQSEADEEGEPEQGEQEQQGEPAEGEQSEQKSSQQPEPAEAWSEEDAQAMEQWLRRIPDDPGGLLRRKFRNQHQRRGAPEDESESW